jgi:hypothetical protein
VKRKEAHVVGKKPIKQRDVHKTTSKEAHLVGKALIGSGHKVDPKGAIRVKRCTHRGKESPQSEEKKTEKKQDGHLVRRNLHNERKPAEQELWTG